MADKKEENNEKVATPLPTFEQKDVEANKIIAAVGYLNILFLVPLLARKDSKFAMACAKQGIIITIGQIIGGITSFLGIGVLIYAIFAVLSIIGFIMAIQGKYWRLPLVGEMGEKLKI